jgi:hypothetical protein
MVGIGKSDDGLGRIWKEVVVAELEVLRRQWPGGIQGNYDKPQSE